MKILVGCEESQAVTIELRKLGHEAYSCDLLDCSGGHPEWHYKDDLFNVIDNEKWDMLIAHPPCTFLAVSGARWMYNKDGSVNEDRLEKQNNALDFVRKIMKSNIPKIAIENPISVISSKIRKPDQIVQPWQFGDKAQKSTCLWLKNLPLLEPTNIVSKGEFKEWTCTKTGKKKRQALWYYEALLAAKTPQQRRTLRSKTFPGIAKAMAEQWTTLLLLLLLPAVLIGQTFKTTQYISTHGSDSIYRGAFDVGIYDSLFLVKSDSQTIIAKKIVKNKGRKYYFIGGYIKKAFDLDGKLHGYWLINRKCRQYYFFKKDW